MVLEICKFRASLKIKRFDDKTFYKTEGQLESYTITH